MTNLRINRPNKDNSNRFKTETKTTVDSAALHLREILTIRLRDIKWINILMWKYIRLI